MNYSLHLVSDLDGTWIPSEEDIASLRKLEAFLNVHPEIHLTFATGRSLPSALRAVARLVKVWPRHFITDVGTAIYHFHKHGQWVEDSEYAAWVASRWDSHFLKGPIEGWLPAGVRRQSGVIAPRRLALEVEPGRDALEASQELERNLEIIGMKADVLVTGRCIDVLPKGVDKGTAASHLQTHFSPPMPMVACGDSENDIGLFRVADLFVLMANSSLDLEAHGMQGERIRRTSSQGPVGILDVLLSLSNDKVGVR